MLAEHQYVDRDYLRDFSEYYATCFEEYSRFCKRLHFFSSAFDHHAFENLLLGDQAKLSAKILQNSYLGFAVIKPLPLTVIGRTCVRACVEDDFHEHYPTCTSYDANLFGVPLEVKPTLPFQEQDQAVAACATSALWSSFHATGMVGSSTMPSPSQITAEATAGQQLDSRAFPNVGLTSAMMARAIQSVGLEPLLLNPYDLIRLRCIAYAYLRGKVPAILGLDMYKVTNAAGEKIGKHAVAASGYRIGENEALPIAGFKNLRLRGSRVDRFYVHDDQIGPFAEMRFDGNGFKSGATDIFDSLTTEWDSDSGAKILARPDIVLLPIYHKIRITFLDILHVVAQFNEVVRIAANLEDNELTSFEWDVYVSDVNSIKGDLREDPLLSGFQLRDLLVQGMPRFIWNATLRVNDDPWVRLLFDATDINQGKLLVCAIEYDQGFCDLLRLIGRSRFDLGAAQVRSVFEWFADTAREVPGHG